MPAKSAIETVQSVLNYLRAEGLDYDAVSDRYTGAYALVFRALCELGEEATADARINLRRVAENRRKYNRRKRMQDFPTW